MNDTKRLLAPLPTECSRSTCIHKLYTQTDAIRVALHLALDALLGPSAALGAKAAGTPRRWTLGSATVAVVEHALGAEGDRLHLGSTGTRCERRQRALSKRTEQVARQMHIDADSGIPGAVCAALIEFSPPKTYRAALDSDPYHALRLGCAHAGWVAQFITTEVEETAAILATAGAADGTDHAEMPGDTDTAPLPQSSGKRRAGSAAPARGPALALAEGVHPP